ncbi:MAG: hypothetical protein IKJ11_04945 [Clostridia bacterium]|nr:hypothetical protein [Clostridia bacterium]
MKTLMQPVRIPVQEFGACLKQILESKRISASELARVMAYKSRNSIFRILDDEGGHGVRLAFYEKLIQEDPLSLTEEERQALFQALEVSRVGRRTFLGNYAMRELLMDIGEEAARPRIRVDAHGSREDPDFKKAIAMMARARKAHLMISGCCERAIFDVLRELIYKTDVTCKVKVTHYIYTGEDEIVHNISAIQPLLYCDFYTAYCVEPGVFSKERERIYRQNCIYVHMQDENGTWYGQPLMLIDKGVFLPLKRIRSGENDPFMQYFADDLRLMPLLKADFSGGQMENYLAYTRSCRALEMNRTIYTIKLDVPLSFIHPEILLPCLTEDFLTMAGGDAGTMVEELWRIHLARWENIFGKRRKTHTIFSREAMERFARTGRQSDHFFAIRSYTPEERVKILSLIRTQAQDNPDFRVYFFREDFVPPLTEIGLYEGEGTLMTKPYTHYDLAGDHAETIIKQNEFCQRYKEFYVKDLLERHVVSQAETFEYLDRLIQIAQKL